VRRRIYRLSLSPKVVGPDLPPDLLGEGGEREQVGAGCLEVVGDLGELVRDGVQEPVELGVDGLDVDLVEDRVQHRLDPGPRRRGESPWV
jgi:hypothetical protein